MYNTFQQKLYIFMIYITQGIHSSQVVLTAGSEIQTNPRNLHQFSSTKNILPKKNKDAKLLEYSKNHFII